MRTALTTVMFVLLALPAEAGGDWVQPSGRLTFGATDRVPGASVFVAGDADVRLAWQGFPLGLQVGVYGYVNEADSPHETYASLTWDFDGGPRIALGVPRPAYDGFAVSAVDAAFPTLGADRARASRSEATWGAMLNGYLPHGLRIDHSAGPFRLAASVHHTRSQGVTVASAGLSYERGPLLLSAAVESRIEPGESTCGKVQAVWQTGPVMAGLGVYAPQAAGEADWAEIFATVTPGNGLSVTGILQAGSDGPATVGVSTRYRIGGRYDLSVGVVDAGGRDPVFSAGIGLNF